MGLITVNYNKFCVAAVESPDVIQKAEDQYDDVFEDKIGTLPGDPVRLHCEENCIPKIMPARREPVALREKVKVKLEEMCLAGVLAKVDKPTDWVSQMVVTEKKSGDLRICLDPRPLNDVLKHEQYTLPTLEDTLTQLSNAKVFTKLDLSNGYWHVPMEEESSYLTTFITDHGRFRWLRLPFGLSVSSEIFQKRLHQAIDGLPGVICVADDIVVYGSGGNKDTATKDHDVKLAAVLERCRNSGIALNKKKMEVRKESITFLGHVISHEGLKPDPEKITAILDMPAPTNKEEVQSLQGTVNYLSKFLPNLSQVMEPIRQLTVNGVKFQWGKSQKSAFEEIKLLITKAPILAYYDPQKKLVLQCDASNKGLGATLLQDGKPIAYKSRSLTDTETRYATIEKEMLAVIWGLEKFHQYTYGRSVLVKSDHKPLEAIVKKPLNKAPKRLQNMLLRSQNYIYTIEWQKGENQYIADMLSRASLPNTEEE
jgi:hypothetical protein